MKTLHVKSLLSLFGFLIVSIASLAQAQGGLNNIPDLDDYLRQYVNDPEFLEVLEKKPEFLKADTIYWSAERGLLETTEFQMKDKVMLPVNDSKIELPFLYMECDTVNEHNLRLIIRMSIEPNTDSPYELNDVVLIAYLKSHNNFFAIRRKRVKELTHTQFIQ